MLTSDKTNDREQNIRNPPVQKGSNVTVVLQLPLVGVLGHLFTAQLHSTGCKLKLLRLLY